MKKAIFILAALMMLVSSVAAVSAYEAHLINVTAHVENALTVNTANVSFGTVFPQEYIKYHRSIRLSDSANTTLGEAPGDLDSVEYGIYAEWKPVPAGLTPTPVVLDGSDEYYSWLGEWLWVGLDASQDPFFITGLTWVGAAPSGPPGATAGPIVTGNLTANNKSDLLGIAILAPVFENYYNALTDTKPGWWPSQWQPIPNTDPRHVPDGVDLGLDLKIQVTKINRVP
jgi:hypothetical protein